MSPKRKPTKVTSSGAKTAVMYVRVSSQEQEDEGYSTDAQERLLKEYAKKHGYKIIRTFEDVETAKRAGRSEFGKMIAFIEEQDGRCQHILAEKTDRIYRNIKDWVIIEDLGVDLHLVKEGKIISSTAPSNDKFHHGIQVLMAKHYIDNLSEEVTKGMLEKARQGCYPSRAPMGYKNVGEKRRKFIVVDPEVGPIIPIIFQEYSTGVQSLEDVRRTAYDNGLKTKAGKPIGRSQIEQILKNEFYTGWFTWMGQTFRGDHDPLVSVELFERVQKELGRRRNHHGHEQTKEHLYRGMLVCGGCGHTMTPDTQKGIVYYHCTGRARSGCRVPYASEEKIDLAISEALQRLRFDDEVFAWVTTALKTSKEDERRYRQQQLDRLRQEVTKLQNRLDKIYDDKLDEVISVQDYERLSVRYRKEMDTANATIDAHLKADRSYVDLGVKLLELVQSVGKLYLRQSPKERRKMASLVFSNCIWKDGKLVAQFRKPFDLLEVTKEKTATLVAVGKPFEAGCPDWLPSIDDERGVRLRFRPGRLYDEGRIWAYRERRQLRLTLISPQPRQTRDAYLRRGWMRNPIVVAQEMAQWKVKKQNATQAQVAERFGVSRSRVAQYLGLLRLPNDVVAFVVADENEDYVAHLTEGNLREIAAMPDPIRQRRAFAALLSGTAPTVR